MAKLKGKAKAKARGAGAPRVPAWKRMAGGMTADTLIDVKDFAEHTETELARLKVEQRLYLEAIQNLRRTQGTRLRVASIMTEVSRLADEKNAEGARGWVLKQELIKAEAELEQQRMSGDPDWLARAQIDALQAERDELAAEVSRLEAERDRLAAEAMISSTDKTPTSTQAY